MKSTFVSVMTFVWIAMSLGGLLAQTNNSYPMLMSAKPTAIPIGQSYEVELNARYNMAGATHVFISGSGVVGEVIADEKQKPEDRSRNDIMASKCKVRFSTEPDVIPGVRDFRVITPHGASTVGQIVLSRDPITLESSDNDIVANAQKVSLPATLCGTIEKAEDVDYYQFHVDAGTALTFHVRSQRLMNRLHDMQTRIDPMISVKTEMGTTIAASDNFYAGDPLLHHKFEHAGNYLLEVRDVRYQGNPDWAYSIEVHSRPFVTQAVDLVVKAGEESKLSFVGYEIPPNGVFSWNASKTHLNQVSWLSPVIAGQPTNEVAVFVTDLAIVRQTEVSPTAIVATDGTSQAESMTQTFSVPAALSGCIEKPGETDRYQFEAKAQEKFAFEVVARRAKSELDPIIRITNMQGGVLAEADDGNFLRVGNADSIIENWTAPADGKYQLEIRDLHQRGGIQFPYAIKATRAEGSFQLEADTDKTVLAPGVNSVIYVRALRKNGFTGEVQLAVEGLPTGVTAVCGRILPDLLDGCIILQAAADAPPGASNIRIVGTGVAKDSKNEPIVLSTEASVLQEYYSPGGGRGNYPVEFHTVSVESPMDIRTINVTPTKIELKPGTSQRIDVSVERAPDYKGNVTLDVILQHLEQAFGTTLPKGVKVDVGASKTLLSANESNGFITLAAASDAPLVENQLVPLNVHVSINFVMKHTFCGPPLSVSVIK